MHSSPKYPTSIHYPCEFSTALKSLSIRWLYAANTITLSALKALRGFEPSTALSTNRHSVDDVYYVLRTSTWRQQTALRCLNKPKLVETKSGLDDETCFNIRNVVLSYYFNTGLKSAKYDAKVSYFKILRSLYFACFEHINKGNTWKIHYINFHSLYPYIMISFSDNTKM